MKKRDYSLVVKELAVALSDREKAAAHYQKMIDKKERTLAMEEFCRCAGLVHSLEEELERDHKDYRSTSR
jgi:hypothetical protein